MPKHSIQYIRKKVYGEIERKFKERYRNIQEREEKRKLRRERKIL